MKCRLRIVAIICIGNLVLLITGCSSTYKFLSEKWEKGQMYLSEMTGDNSAKKITTKLEEANNAIGKLKLTEENKLCGIKGKSDSDYLGDYQSDYNKFTGAECVFGGMSYDTEGISKINISGSFDTKGGEVKIIFINGVGETVLFDEKNDVFDMEIETQGGLNYIVVECKEYEGRLELKLSN